MSKIDLIVERLKAAPPEVVEEILALLEKVGPRPVETPANPPRGIFDLIGVLKDSKAFVGDPVELQRKMRDEWN